MRRHWVIVRLKGIAFSILSISLMALPHCLAFQAALPNSLCVSHLPFGCLGFPVESPLSSDRNCLLEPAQ